MMVLPFVAPGGVSHHFIRIARDGSPVAGFSFLCRDSLVSEP